MRAGLKPAPTGMTAKTSDSGDLLPGAALLPAAGRPDLGFDARKVYCPRDRPESRRRTGRCRPCRNLPASFPPGTISHRALKSQAKKLAATKTVSRRELDKLSARDQQEVQTASDDTLGSARASQARQTTQRRLQRRAGRIPL